MQTLDQLRSGALQGAVRLTLREELRTFPREIFDLADTLEVLDLSGNRLDTLPDDFARLHKLRILFLSDNAFETLPEVLGACRALSMVGFKANRIADVPEVSLPPGLRWLILTDNRIVSLPLGIAARPALQKLMLSGNRLHTLPETMVACRNLELIRISANAFESLPSWLTELPRLAWLAGAGNPGFKTAVPHEVPSIHWQTLQMAETLGSGASGQIYRAMRAGEAVAVKLFKGAVTSDGYPLDEMRACIAAGDHPHLTTLHGRLTGHPQGTDGLVLALIPPTYRNLGNPPSLQSCTRDTYDDSVRFTLPQVHRIARQVASAAMHLHGNAVMHGDLYAHNILIDASGHSLLGDFGAATCYDRSMNGAFERLEVRAFGILVAELLERCDGADRSLLQLAAECMDERVLQRPRFGEVAAAINALS